MYHKNYKMKVLLLLTFLPLVFAQFDHTYIDVGSTFSITYNGNIYNMEIYAEVCPVGYSVVAHADFADDYAEQENFCKAIYAQSGFEAGGGNLYLAADTVGWQPGGCWTDNREVNHGNMVSTANAGADPQHTGVTYVHQYCIMPLLCPNDFTCNAGTQIKNDLSAACATDTCDNNDCCDALSSFEPAPDINYFAVGSVHAHIHPTLCHQMEGGYGTPFIPQASYYKVVSVDGNVLTIGHCQCAILDPAGFDTCDYTDPSFALGTYTLEEAYQKEATANQEICESYGTGWEYFGYKTTDYATYADMAASEPICVDINDFAVGSVHAHIHPTLCHQLEGGYGTPFIPQVSYYKVVSVDGFDITVGHCQCANLDTAGLDTCDYTSPNWVLGIYYLWGAAYAEVTANAEICRSCGTGFQMFGYADTDYSTCDAMEAAEPRCGGSPATSPTLCSSVSDSSVCDVAQIYDPEKANVTCATATCTSDECCTLWECAENEHVVNSQCVACGSGLVNPAGDEADQGDTTCTPPPDPTCFENSYSCFSGLFQASAVCTGGVCTEEICCSQPDTSCSSNNYNCTDGQTLIPDGVCPASVCTALICCLLPGPPPGGGSAPVCSTIYDQTSCCSESNCAYNGNCIDSSALTGVNLCPSSASAPAPSTPITCADSPCQNGGTCTDINGEFSCNCNYNGWQGPTCEDDYAECAYQHRNNCPVEIVQQNGVDITCSSLNDCRAIDNAYQCYNGVCKKYSYACTELIGTYQCICGEGFNGDGYTCVDANLPCLTNERVSAGSCVPCETGQINEAGDFPNGTNTTCEYAPCTLNVTTGLLTDASIGCMIGAASGTYGNCACACTDGFSGQFCDECALGFGFDGSDCLECVSPYASDTTLYSESCHKQTCGVNKRLASVFDTNTLDEAVNCEACPAGMESNASSLVCTDILCAENEKVSANVCEACPIGKINAVGNSASGNDTNCEDIICTSDLTPSTLTNSSIGCVFGSVIGIYGGCACVCSNGFTGQFCDQCALGFGSDGSDCFACISPFASDTSGLEACQEQTCGVNKRLASVFDTTTLDEAVNCEDCPAGMESDNTSIVCTDILCAEDEKVSGNACVACPAGKINAAGNSAAGNNTNCNEMSPCQDDEYVSSNACVTCAAGTTNVAGNLRSGSDTSCVSIVCGADEYVLNNVCTACGAGSTNDAGDQAAGNDTTCEPTLCLVDEFVSSHVCTPCESGLNSNAGFDASGADTVCVTACLEGFVVESNICVQCPANFSSDAGLNPLLDDTPATFPNPPGPDTVCFNDTMCGNAVYKRVHCHKENTIECANDRCICKDGFTGKSCDKQVLTSTEIGLIFSSPLLLTDSEAEAVQQSLSEYLEDVVTSEYRKPGSVTKNVVFSHAVELEILNARQWVLSRGQGALLAVAPDIVADDDCDVNPLLCPSVDLSDVSEGKILVLETPKRIGAWSIVSKGGSIISKQTRNSPNTYFMSCWQNGAWSPNVYKTKGSLQSCNGFVLQIGSQAVVCEATVGTDIGTCGAHGACGVDGASWVCNCDDGWSGAHCETPFTVPSHCHEFNCDSFGGHAGDITIPDGTAQSALVGLCCNYPTRAAFDVMCMFVLDQQSHLDLGCCHRENCI